VKLQDIQSLQTGLQIPSGVRIQKIKEEPDSKIQQSSIAIISDILEKKYLSRTVFATLR